MSNRQRHLIQKRWRSFLSALIIFSLGSLLGCQQVAIILTSSASSTSISVPLSFNGSVFGGPYPVGGAQIQLYAAGISGPGSASIPLLPSPIKTAADGSFSIAGLANCPSADTPVYLLATGVPGGSATSSAVAMMTILGPCAALTASTNVVVNEVTTIGSIWPLASYMASPTNLGSQPNDTSFASAVANVTQFIDIKNGSTPGVPGSDGYFEQAAKLNMLADAIAACINTDDGSAAEGGACAALFALATPSNGVAPINTVAAALYIAQNPTRNISQIFDLISANPPIQPILNAVPTDWTLKLTDSVGSPSISPPSGTYSGSQEVAITSSTVGSSIRYTIDGTMPTSNSPLYNGPLT